MKNLIIILLTFITIVSCKKKSNSVTTNSNTSNQPVIYSYEEGKHFKGNFYINNYNNYFAISYISPNKYTLGYPFYNVLKNADTTAKLTSINYTLTTIECSAGCIDKGIIMPDSIVVSLLMTTKSDLKVEYPTKSGYKSKVFIRQI